MSYKVRPSKGTGRSIGGEDLNYWGEGGKQATDNVWKPLFFVFVSFFLFLPPPPPFVTSTTEGHCLPQRFPQGSSMQAT